MGLKEQLEAEIAMLEGRLGYRSGGRVQRFNTGGDPDATTPYYTDDDVEADEPPDQWPNPALTGGYPGTGGDTTTPPDNTTPPDPYPDPGVDPNPGDGGTVPNPGGSGDIPPFQMAGWDENGNFVGFTPEEIQAMTDQLQSEGTDQSTIDAFLSAAAKGWNALTTFFSDNKNSNLLKGALGLWLGERNRRSNKENNEANRQDTRNSQEQRAREFLVNQQDEVHTEYATYMDRADSRNRAEMAQRIAMGVPRHIAEADFNEAMRQAEQTALNRASSRMGYIQASMKGAPYAGGVMDAAIAFGASGQQPGGTTTQPAPAQPVVTPPPPVDTTVQVPDNLTGTIPVVGAPGGNAGAAGAQRIDTGAGGLMLAGQGNPTVDAMYSTGRANEFQAARGGRVPARGGLSQISQQPRYYAGGTKGQDDRIPALLSDGEYVMDAETVAALGDGNSKAGAAELDRMRERIRRHKRSGSIKKIPPKSKGALNYLKGGR